MSFTYDLSTDVGRVRLLAQDTVEASARFSDEEITYLISSEGTVRATAAAMLEADAVRLSGLLSEEKIGDYSYRRSPADLLKTAAALREQDTLNANFEIADDVTNSFHLAGE